MFQIFPDLTKVKRRKNSEEWTNKQSAPNEIHIPPDASRRSSEFPAQVLARNFGNENMIYVIAFPVNFVHALRARRAHGTGKWSPLAGCDILVICERVEAGGRERTEQLLIMIPG